MCTMKPSWISARDGLQGLRFCSLIFARDVPRCLCFSTVTGITGKSLGNANNNLISDAVKIMRMLMNYGLIWKIAASFEIIEYFYN